VNSRAKGKRGELEFCRFLRNCGYSAHRGQQHRGGPDSPDARTDVSIPSDPSRGGGFPVHFEVKRTEALRLEEAMEQSLLEARVGELAVVAHRRSRGEWLLTMRLEDFLLRCSRRMPKR
jgi:hypothetical protein